MCDVKCTSFIGISGFGVFGFLEFWDFESLGFWDFGILEFEVFGTLGFGDFGIWSF